MHSESVKTRTFCRLQTLRVIMCDRERQSGLKYFMCFEQNVVEADRFLLILFEYVYFYIFIYIY